MLQEEGPERLKDCGILVEVLMPPGRPGWWCPQWCPAAAVEEPGRDSPGCSVCFGGKGYNWPERRWEVEPSAHLGEDMPVCLEDNPQRCHRKPQEDLWEMETRSSEEP